MNFAVHGFLAEGTGSSAGTFPLLLRTLLERGHLVDFYGIPEFSEPKSLVRFPRYRFIPLVIPAVKKLWRIARALPTEYPSALCSQITHLMYHRETMRLAEADQERARYDLILITDTQALWPSELPIVCWPQGPPHTEAAALRHRDLVPSVIKNMGVGRYAAVQLFYAYRRVVARAALDVPDLYLIGSDWARDSWAEFGVPRERLRTIGYPIDLSAFAGVPSLASGERNVTFLWLGRAVPRKRLDLFLAAFELLHRRMPSARARLVGSLLDDPYAKRVLEPYLGHPAIRFEEPWPRARVPELFGEVDVLVQPSQNENFGFSVAEALASGRPIVFGPLNGTGEYTGGAGFRFSEYNAESIAGAMERAHTAVVGSGADITRAAREAAARHFTIDTVVDRFSELCGEALDRRRTAV
jgi:glycosyltransferase involved in cell wall biosynthesis